MKLRILRNGFYDSNGKKLFLTKAQKSMMLWIISKVLRCSGTKESPFPHIPRSQMVDNLKTFQKSLSKFCIVYCTTV